MLRMITEDSWEELEELEMELFDNCFNATTLRTEVKSGSHIWVAGARRIDGYMIIRESLGLADILRLGVRPSLQRNGIGTYLLEIAIKKFPNLMLCVRKHNTGAIALYHKHRFTIAGDLNSSWVMRLTSSEKCSSDRTSRTG